MKLAAIVPAYNEQATVAQVLAKLAKNSAIDEIIVVDDGSTDATWQEINTVKSKKIKALQQSNQGKGSAVRFALQEVTSDYVLIQDADLEYDPADIPLLVAALKREQVQVVYGSRFLGPHSNLLFWHRVGNFVLNLVVNVLYNSTLSDMETGYKLLPTALMQDLNLTAQQFDLEPEITCKLLKRGIHIFEVPISYVGRTFEQGKKITWKDGLAALWVILKLRIVN